MSFFSGGITYSRFKINGPTPLVFNQWHLDQLAEHRVRNEKMWVPALPLGGINLGWSAGKHVLDTRFTFEKNVINDMLVFSLVGEAHKIPAELRPSYYEEFLAELAAGNPSGFASAMNRREAKQAVQERIERESADGRWLRRQAIEAVWDRRSNELLFASTSVTARDRFAFLFKEAFGWSVEPVTAGMLALDHATEEMLDEATPTPFLPGLSPIDNAWIPGNCSRDWLGNEFLLWLWYQCEDGEETFTLPDRSEATVFMSHMLALECPRGVSGHETITHEGPTRLPEALRAIQGGKLPRKSGLMVVRHDVQYELKLNAETMAVTGAKIPAPEDSDATARLQARADQIRDLRQTLDLMFGAFCELRFSDEWPDVTGRIRRWLQREER